MHFICGYCHLVRLYFFSLLFFPTSLVWIVMQTVSFFDPMLIYWITCFRFILFVALRYVFHICVIVCYFFFVSMFSVFINNFLMINMLSFAIIFLLLSFCYQAFHICCSLSFSYHAFHIWLLSTC